MFLPCQCCGDDTDVDDDSSSRVCRFGNVSHTLPRGFYINGPPFDNPKLLHRDYGGETMYVELKNPLQPCQGFSSEIRFFYSASSIKENAISGNISGSTIRNKIKISSFYHTKIYLSNKKNFNSVNDVPNEYIIKNLKDITLVFSDNEFDADFFNPIGYVLTKPNDDGDYLLPEEVRGYILDVKCLANGQVTQPDGLKDVWYGNENIFSKKTLMSDFDDVLSGSEDGVSWQAENLFDGDTNQVLFSWNSLGKSYEETIISDGRDDFYSLGYNPFLTGNDIFIPDASPDTNTILTNFEIQIPDLSGNGISEMQVYILGLAAGSYTMPFGINLGSTTSTGTINACCKQFGPGSQPSHDFVQFCSSYNMHDAHQFNFAMMGKFTKTAPVSMYSGLQYLERTLHPRFRESDGQGYHGFEYPTEPPGNTLPPTNSETGEELTADTLDCRQKFARTADLELQSSYSFVKIGNHKAPDGSYLFTGYDLPETSPAVEFSLKLRAGYRAYYHYGWYGEYWPLFSMTSALEPVTSYVQGWRESRRWFPISSDHRQSEYGLSATIPIDCTLHIVNGYRSEGPYVRPVYDAIPFTATFGPSNPLP